VKLLTTARVNEIVLATMSPVLAENWVLAATTPGQVHNFNQSSQHAKVNNETQRAYNQELGESFLLL
jgi:hypothetical protein